MRLCASGFDENRAKSIFRARLDIILSPSPAIHTSCFQQCAVSIKTWLSGTVVYHPQSGSQALSHEHHERALLRY